MTNRIPHSVGTFMFALIVSFLSWGCGGQEDGSEPSGDLEAGTEAPVEVEAVADIETEAVGPDGLTVDYIDHHRLSDEDTDELLAYSEEVTGGTDPEAVAEARAGIEGVLASGRQWLVDNPEAVRPIHALRFDNNSLLAVSVPSGCIIVCRVRLGQTLPPDLAGLDGPIGGWDPEGARPSLPCVHVNFDEGG